MKSLRIKKVILVLLSVASLSVFSWQAYSLYSSPVVNFFVDREIDAIGSRVQLAMLQSATPEHVTKRIRAALQPVPADWDGIDLLRAFAAENGIALPDYLLSEISRRELLERGEEDSLANSCYRCIKDSESCPVSVAKGCDIAVEMTPLGDIRSINAGLSDWRAGKPVDTLDVSLATVGLVATAGSFFTAGSSYSVKIGTGLIKAARKTGSFSKPFLRFLKNNTDELLDFSRIPKRWHHNPASIMRAVNPAQFSELKSVLLHLGGIRGNVGTVKALRIISVIDNGTDARRMNLASDALKTDTPKALEVLGKKRLLKQTYRINPKITRMASSFAAFVASLLGIFWGAVSAFFSAVIRLVRVSLNRQAQEI